MSLQSRVVWLGRALVAKALSVAQVSRPSCRLDLFGIPSLPFKAPRNISTGRVVGAPLRVSAFPHLGARGPFPVSGTGFFGVAFFVAQLGGADADRAESPAPIGAWHQWVSPDALVALGVRRSEALSAQHVLPVRDRLQVVRVHTAGIATQVVERKPFGYRADEQPIRGSVRGKKHLAVDYNSRLAVSGTSHTPRPIPAFVGFHGEQSESFRKGHRLQGHSQI